MTQRPMLSSMLLMIAVLVLAACADDDIGVDDAEAAEATAIEETEEPAETPPEAEPTEEATATPEPEPAEAPAAEITPDGEVKVVEDEDRPPYWTRWWEDTDLDKHSVPLSEISSGGVPRDGIPPIDEPKFVGFDEADEWLGEMEPVISFELKGDARAYPLQILTWHEIVNDEVGGAPVAVTFCPLCNAAISFEREVEGYGVMRFGVSGLLRYSDLVMWDDQTESLWQQMTGEAIVGEMTGTQLTLLPSIIVSYEEFKQTHPDGRVLSQDTGHQRPYGNNPYAGYDSVTSSPFLFFEERDERLPTMERVLTLIINDEAKAYPFSELEEHPVVHDDVGGEPVVVFWQAGATSALDKTSIAESREVGSANAFLPVLNGETLTFVIEDGLIRDEQTGSTWNVLGLATDGPLEGQRLEQYLTGTHFWFAWAAFQPESGIWSP